MLGFFPLQCANKCYVIRWKEFTGQRFLGDDVFVPRHRYHVGHLQNVSAVENIVQAAFEFRRVIGVLRSSTGTAQAQIMLDSRLAVWVTNWKERKWNTIESNKGNFPTVKLPEVVQRKKNTFLLNYIPEENSRNLDLNAVTNYFDLGPFHLECLNWLFQTFFFNAIYFKI